MMDARQTFLEQIAEDDMNEESHLVYADWLEENGEDEEADRQRKYVPAKQWIIDLCERLCNNRAKKIKEYMEDWPEDYEDQTLEEACDNYYDKITYDELMEIATEAIEKNPDKPWIGNGHMNWGGKESIMNDFSNDYSPGEQVKEFWKNWEIVTGLQGPEDPLSVGYSCAC